MSDARIPPTAELGSRGIRRPRVAAAVLSALVTATSFPVVLGARPAGADQVASLQAEAAALAQQLVRQQLEVDADQQQYSVASAQVAADDQAVAALDQQIAATQSAIASRTSAIRTQAVRSYVEEGANSAAATVLTGSANRLQAAAEYQSIAVGNITAQIDRLRTAQHSLQAQRAELAAREAADRVARAEQASSLSEAGQAAQQLAAAHAQVTGQLATAVASAQARQAAAAVAAVNASHRSATSRSVPAVGAAAPGNGGGPSAPVASGSDPPLPPFLQCVVQAESGGDYGAVSPNGEYMGAFQFSQSTWNLAAQDAGRPDLVGVPPNQASKADQDTLAVVLYHLDGMQPWLGDRCSS
ncbi:MAG TPA: transglycosylase family protein [Acidimicrobiales bacterium]|nr:transglycosylase family protein [Acidimicrobiales bacterium]